MICSKWDSVLKGSESAAARCTKCFNTRRGVSATLYKWYVINDTANKWENNHDALCYCYATETEEHLLSLDFLFIR